MPLHQQPAKLLDAALAYHQSGKLDQAAALYQQVLAQHPGQADALYLYGVLHHQLGRHQEAVDLILRAIEKNRRDPDWFNTLGEAYRGLGRLDDAIQAYRRALKIEPRLVEALGNLGLTLHDQGKLEEATQCYERVLRIAPQSLPALINLGAIYQDRGKHAEAITWYRRAIELDPSCVDAHFNLGLLYREQRYYEDARRHLDIVVQLNPSHAEAWFELGKTFHKLARHENALHALEKAIALRPNYPEANYQIAVTLARLKRHDDARRHFQWVVAYCRNTLAAHPEDVGMHQMLGNALNELDDPDEAAASYQRAIEIKPDYVDALINLTNILLGRRQFEEAEALLDRALDIVPDRDLLHINKGIALALTGRFEQAEKHFQRALALSPNFATAHVDYAIVLLRYGQFESAWREYVFRHQQLSGLEYIQDPRDPSRVLPKPSTLMPLDLKGKRILFILDQGIGDELFFLRFMPTLRQRGAWLAYQPSAKLAEMLDRARVVDQIVQPPDYPANLDYIFSVGDVPLVAGMRSVNDIPRALPLVPLPSQIERMMERLVAAGPGPYLGVTWRGGLERQPGDPARLLKHIEPEMLARAVSGWPGTVLVLQRNPKPGEVERFSSTLGRQAHDFSQVNEDLEAMLALLSLIDDYLGVSNANMHLRAGLGLTAKVLVPEPAEWRWMARGAESPWFPGFKLYRESMSEGWEPAIRALAADIANSPKRSPVSIP
jgi:tetratricopeptide (TPR) repeat protein